MSLLRKRTRQFTVQQRTSIHLPLASASKPKVSVISFLRSCVAALVAIAALLQITLMISTQPRGLTFRNFDITMRTKARYKTVFYVSGNHTEVQIRETDERDYSKWRRKFLKSIDDEDMDDYYDPDQDVDVSCRRTNWARAMHSTCHAFHEIAMDSELYQGELEYLGRGTYRSAWLLHKENVVCKTTILPNPRRRFDAKTFTLTLTDANIMEALSASNRIADIYGYCGSSVMTESLEDTVLSDLLGGDSKDPDDESFDKTVCQNSLTLDQKLDMAIQFSEALAELQGYVGGAMMHGDLLLCGKML